MNTLSRRFSPMFAVGERVVLTCEGKAELGMTGMVTAVRPYAGPRMYASWECTLRDVRWADGTPTSQCTVRETWLALREDTAN